MTRSKAVAALTLLLLAPVLSRAQSTPSPSPTASTEESLVGPFYWGKSGDVETWLKAHESFLRRGDGCSLLVSWMGKGPYGSANHNVALFMIAPGGDYEENSIVIHDSASPSGLDIRVGAKYFPAGGRIEELEIALAFEGKPDDVFGEITAVEAHTVRDKNWKVLGLVKRIEIGDLQYRYSLECENGKTFMSFLRKPAKHHRHSSLAQ